MSAKPRHPTSLLGALSTVALWTMAAASVQAHTRITTDITWADDVRAILRQHCMRCHSPGGIAPDYADFTTYGTDSRPGARAWATAIEEELLTGRMPPWQADPRFDDFRNSRTLSQREIDLITAWVEGGAPQGPRRNLPTPDEFLDEWLLGEPDLLIEPANDFVIPPGQREMTITVTLPVEADRDSWITAYEFKPDNPRSVLRMAGYILDPEGEPESLELETQVPYDPFRDEDGPEPTRWREMPRGRRFLGQWLRGDEPVLFPDLAGLRLRKGSRIELQIAFQRQQLEGADDEIRDRSRLGLFLSRSEDEVEKILESRSSALPNLSIKGKKATKRPARTALTVDEDGHLFAISPWVGNHVATLEVRALFPDDRERTLLWIPDYDPRWPASFVLEEPLPVSAGTRIEMVATFREPEGKEAIAQDFELNIDYTLDDHLVLPEPEIQPRQASAVSRGGMLVDLFGQGLPDSADSDAPAPIGTSSDDPNASAHMDHSALHGGQFFMAANNYHHLEGALPEAGEFRFYVYDDFKQPVDPRNFAGSVVFETFDESSGEFAETEYPLEAVPGTDYLMSRIPPELPSEFFASVWLAGEQARFDFYFEDTTVEPAGAPSGRPALTRAGPHSHERPSLVIPEEPQAIVGEILLRTEQLVEKIEAQDWLTIYIPAFDAKDLAESLLSGLSDLSARDRGKVRRGIGRIMQSTVEMERAGDLADEARLRRALDRYRDGLDDIVEVYDTAR